MSELYHSGVRRRDGRPWRPALANHGHCLRSSGSREPLCAWICVYCWRTFTSWQIREGYTLPICTGRVRALRGESTR